MAMDESEPEEILGALASSDPVERFLMLLVLADDPSGEARVRAAVEPLIEDRASRPARRPAFRTEVRWHAAHALAAERRLAGISEEVSLSDVIAPLDVATIVALAEDAYGDDRPRTAELCFERLRHDGRLPTEHLIG